MRFLTKLSLVLCLAALPAFTGCGKGGINYIDHDDVEVADSDYTEEDGFMTVHMTFKNNSGDVNHSVYRVEWFDKDGRHIESTAWRPVTLRGNVLVRATERSTVPGADDFIIQITNDAR